GTNNKPDQNIYSSVRSAATGTWSTPNLRVNDDTAQNPVQRSPRLAGTPAGIETAVWVDLRASQNNIYASSSTWRAAPTGARTSASPTTPARSRTSPTWRSTPPTPPTPSGRTLAAGLKVMYTARRTRTASAGGSKERSEIKKKKLDCGWCSRFRA
ncbi:MAG TPA: hypothetical protein VGS01_04265, partial [Candidatus Limnocylindria bacterium]|nr:hypothetical protein [Candidatus Limnocylindria bacterium]